MIEQILETEKKTLQEYYERLLRINYNFKYLQLKFVWDYIHDAEAFKGICDMIKSRGRLIEMRAYEIVDLQKVIPLPEKHEERITWSYFILEQIVRPNHDISVMSTVGKNYSPGKEGSAEKFFELFNDLFLEPFIFYLLNHAGKHFWILGLLKKYKQRTEWFNKDWLLDIAKSDTTKGETNLKKDLYKYLFDKGLDLSIEPTSPSGEIDFIASQSHSMNKLLVEGKVFDADKRNKTYISKGTWQLLHYLKEYNEPEGYLTIYNISPKVFSPKFNNGNSNFPCCAIDNKKIYFVVIDLHLCSLPASKRPIPNVIELSQEDIDGNKP